MKRHLPAVARVVMGLLFLLMGLNGFLNFLPGPPAGMPASALAFLGALGASGYMVPLASGVQVVIAILLLSNRFVPLALVLIAPVIVNIVAFHLFLLPSGIAPGILVAALEVYLAWIYRDAFRPMLAMRVETARR
jgi:uncharacterized membrane protein YphA (DoxX/SURF4 family)